MGLAMKGTIVKERKPNRTPLESELRHIWLALTIIGAMVSASLMLNAIRTVRVDQGINRLQAENTRLLRERADLMVRSARR